MAVGCLVIKSLLKIDYTCIPKPANSVRLQAKLECKNPTGLSVGVVSYKRKEGTEMDLLLVLLCIALFCVLCVVVWKYNHMNYTAKVVLIVCSLIVFVSFQKKYAFMRL